MLDQFFASSSEKAAKLEQWFTVTAVCAVVIAITSVISLIRNL